MKLIQINVMLSYSCLKFIDDKTNPWPDIYCNTTRQGEIQYRKHSSGNQTLIQFCFHSD